MDFLADLAPAGDFPDGCESAIAHGVEAVMEIDGGAAVAGDEFEQVAGLEVCTGAGDGFEAAVLLGESVAFEVGPVFERRKAVVGRKALEPGVGDALLGRGAASDGGEYGQRVVETEV